MPKFVDDLPLKPGVYLMRNAENTVLYIGKAKVLKTRVKQYYSGHDTREMIPQLLEQVAHIETLITLSEKDALFLEASLIKQHKPKYNVLLKDDKSFIGILIRDHPEWPRIELVRQKGALKEKGKFYGPFTSAKRTHQMFELLTRNFPLRQCSDHELASRKRPCILHSIKRCLAPCVGDCTPQEYDVQVKGLNRFLKGDLKELIRDYQKKMEIASENLQFEDALRYLNVIRQIESFAEHQKSALMQCSGAVDVIGFACLGTVITVVILIFRDGQLKDRLHLEKDRTLSTPEECIESILTQYLTESVAPPEEILVPIPLSSAKILEDAFIIRQKIHTPQKGQKKQLLDLAQENATALLPAFDQLEEANLLHDLQQTLQLSRLPERIECFDTSNMAGTNPVASMVTFVDGKKDTSGYRHYKIQTAHGDDYSAMREVLERRYKKGDIPDLVIVDGGKGQLGLVLDIFQQFNIATVDVIGLAKESARHDKGLTQEQIFLPRQSAPILLPQGPLLFFLQRIRDEAHRFAISYHKKLRQKRVITSVLDEIEGIGPLKKKRLLQHFKSLSAIQEASIEEILEVKSLNRTDAEKILLKLRGKRG